MSDVTGELEVRGVAVHQTATSPAMPAVTTGRFAVRNGGTDEVHVAVASVTVAGEAAEDEVEEYFVYLLPDYVEVPAEGMGVAPGTESCFEVSFAPHALRPHLSHDVAVVVEVLVDGSPHRVGSPWAWTIRTPRR